MARVVVIQAMCSHWPEDKTEGTEVWCVNRSHTVEPRVDRIYYFDPEYLFEDGFLDSINKTGVPVYTRDAVESVTNSVRFPVEDVIAFFNGLCYSTSTVAWCIQHAIYEHCNGNPIDKLVLNGMYHQRDSMEYLWAIPCINYWVGVAVGHGMNIQCYGNNALVKAMPWESGKYGYVRNINADLCINTLSAAYQACYQYPRMFKNAQEEQEATEDYYGLLQTREQLSAMLVGVDRKLEQLHGVKSN